MLFFVKAKIDAVRLIEFGTKLQGGELNTDSIRHTYCYRNDPTMGISVWEADSKEDFEAKFAPYKEYCAEVLEQDEIITPEETKQVLMEQLMQSFNKPAQ